MRRHTLATVLATCALVASAFMTTGATALAQTASDTPPSDPACANGSEVEYVGTSPLIHVYIQAMRVGFEAAAAQYEKQAQWLSSAEFSQANAINYAEQALAYPCLKGIGMIATDPPQFQAVVDRAIQEGKAVVTMGTCAVAVIAPVCIGTNDPVAYANAAKRVAEAVNHTGRVVIATGDPTDLTHKGRRDAMAAYFAANEPDIIVVDDVVNCDTPETTVGCAENALSAYPDMVAYLGTGQNVAIGATTAFPQANRQDIVVMATDDSPEILAGINDGTVSFTVVQNPYGQGYLLFYLPYLMAEKGMTPQSDHLWIDSGSLLVDQSNVATYTEDQVALANDLIAAVDAGLMVPKQ